MKYKSVVGILTYVAYPTELAAHYLELENGEFLTIKFAGGYTQSLEVEDALTRKISLTVSEVEIDGFHVVPVVDKFFTILRNNDMLLMANAAKVKKHIGVFRQVPVGTTDESKAKSMTYVARHVKTIQDYYRRYGGHVWDVEVRGYVMEGEANAHPPYYAKSDTDNYMATHDMEGFEPNYFHIWGGTSGGYCGQGNLPGNRSVTYMNSACGTKTMIHELGHNFGLHHASTFRAGNPDAEPPTADKIVEYGDTSSIMGMGSSVVGINSVDAVRLGLEEDREVKVVTETQQVFVAPFELSERDLRENEYANVRIEKGTTPYHVTLRKVKGAHYGNNRRSEDTLYVYEYARDKHSILILGTMKVGSSKTLPNGAVVKYLEYADETARVNIIYNSSDVTPQDIPMLTGFQVPMGTVTVEPKHSGSWFNRDNNGEGFDIHVKEDRTVLYWYTYNHKQTSRRFYYAVCPTTETGPIEFDILTTEDGTWEDPTLAESITVGKGELFFYDGNNGVFSYDLNDLGRGSIELVPVALSTDHPSNGSYYQPSRSGEGFTIQFYDHLNLCVAYWYSYGPTVRGSYGGYSGNMKQRWYACVGAKNADGTYTLDVSEALDNVWMGLRDEPGVNSVGSATVTIVDDNNIKFDYGINADRVSGTGTYNLTKLF
jgi:hypothetical protein